MQPHVLDAPGARWMWLYPLPHDPMALVDALRAHGITGVVPQQSAAAIAWARQWGKALAARGLKVVIGLGKIDTRGVLAALAEVSAGNAAGVMINQEDWKSVADSNALCSAVLAARPDAPGLVVDCHYPCLTRDPETGKATGWHRIAKAWAPLCGLRAPQCYWARGGGGTKDGPRDGWVGKRLAWAREEYPRAGGSPAERVRISRQQYRASVQDHVDVLLAESEVGSAWLWNWAEADSSARLALRIVVEIERRGHRGPGAVRAAQSAAGITVDGLVGPATCRALGLVVPDGVLWRRR